MTTEYLTQDLIRKKRDGLTLSDDEIRAFISGVTDSSIPDYQAAAMLMAVFLRGLDDAELAVWADAMLHSGEVLDLSSIDRVKVDKHSTGGVGDKISIPLAPAVAACGVAIPMISGRALGHTGGTLDKLESIPGFSVDMDTASFIAQVDRLGVAVIGQSAELAPADRRFYALRDVTATIESVPLIASSIMSKKLAEGIEALVLDCKVGRGAFVKTEEAARRLGQAIQVIGRAAGTRVTVMFTDMAAPIGRHVGNALEIAESIEILEGGGPSDTRELTVRLGGELLLLAGAASSGQQGAAAIAEALDSGAALKVFGEMIAAQGGDPNVLSDRGLLPRARHILAITAPAAGFVHAIDALAIGRGALVMGGGRARKEDAIDPGVGVELAVQVGDRVSAGQLLARLHHNERGVQRARELVAGAFELADTEIASPTSRIREVLR